MRNCILPSKRGMEARERDTGWYANRKIRQTKYILISNFRNLTPFIKQFQSKGTVSNRKSYHIKKMLKVSMRKNFVQNGVAGKGLCSERMRWEWTLFRKESMNSAFVQKEYYYDNGPCLERSWCGRTGCSSWSDRRRFAWAGTTPSAP